MCILSHCLSSLSHWQQQLLANSQGEFKLDRIHPGFIRAFGNSTATSEQRLQVYRNNYQLTLIDWIVKVYPMVCNLVGTPCFRQMAKGYVINNPLNDHNWRSYEQGFVQHISQLMLENDVLKDLPYLTDVANADWYLNQSYYAKKRECFDLGNFSELSEQQQSGVLFILPTDLYVMQSKWPLLALWAHCHHEQVIEQIIQSEENQYYIISREGFKPTIDIITPIEYSLFIAINQSTPLIDLNEEVATLIPSAINKGWIEGFVVA